MIRINLLPFRAARKKENIRRQITIYALVVVLLFTIMVYYSIQLHSTLSNLKDKEKSVQAELKTYQKTVRKINQLEKKIKEIEAKLKVIRQLEKNKTGPVHLLEEIARAVPKDKLWLSSFKESKGSLNLTGTAMDNETVALFMTNLEKSDYITRVNLHSTKLRNLPKYKLRVSDFVLDCKTYAFQEKKPAPKKTARKRRR
jgi:type IV pilus assembly protein PilN